MSSEVVVVEIVKRLKVEANGMVSRQTVMGGGIRVKRHASAKLANEGPLAMAQKGVKDHR